MLKHLDLCSGIGGFALAAKWAGIETIAFCEKDAFCQQVLRKHWPNVPIHNDIKTFAHEQFWDEIDLLTAGFPCQPFSVAGKRKGKDDDRYLWSDIIRIIRGCYPDWLILENVPGIVSHIKPIIDDLEDARYAWKSFIIPASAVGAPHKRERLWLVANRYSFGRYHGSDYGKARHLQDNRERYLQALHEEWPQFIRQSWQTLSADEWLSVNAGLSRIIDGLPNRLDRLKALGNAIVPQVVYPMMKFIVEIENVYERG